MHSRNYICEDSGLSLNRPRVALTWLSWTGELARKLPECLHVLVQTGLQRTTPRASFQSGITSHDDEDNVRDEKEDEATEEKEGSFSLMSTNIHPPGLIIHCGFSWPLSYSVFITNSSSIYFYAHNMVEVIGLERSNCQASPWQFERCRTIYLTAQQMFIGHYGQCHRKTAADTGDGVYPLETYKKSF